MSGFEALSTFSFGPSTPPVNAQGEPWFKTDSQGTPINWFSFNGQWTPIPPPILPGHVMGYWAATAAALNGPWWPCLGQTIASASGGGSIVAPNLQGLTIIGAGTNPATGTSFTAQTQYGEEKHLQTVGELVPHTHASQNSTGFLTEQDTNPFAIASGGAIIGQEPTTASTGGGTGFNVIQPSMAMYYSIFWP